MTDREFWLRIQRKARRMEPELSASILAAFEQLRNSLPLTEMERLMGSASVQRLVSEALDDATLREAFKAIRPELQRVFAESLAFAAKDVPGAGIEFNVLDPRILDAIRELDTKVMGTLTDGVRETVRQHIAAGLEAGKNPRTVARGVKDVIGLTPRHEAAVRNFRRQLETGDLAAFDRQLRRGRLRTPSGRLVARPKHAGGYGFSESTLGRLKERLKAGTLTQKQIDSAVATYRRRLLAWNAESVSRTATLDSMRRGQRVAWEDAIEKGVVDRARLFKRRSEVMDSRTRPEHAAIDGEVRHIDEPYSNGEMVAGEHTFNCRGTDRYFVKTDAMAA